MLSRYLPLVIIAILIAALIGVWFSDQFDKTLSSTQPVDTQPLSQSASSPITDKEDSVTTQQPAVVEEQTPEPVKANSETTPPKVALPNLNNSDGALRAAIENDLAVHQQILNILTPNEIIRKAVIAIENAANGKVAFDHPVLQRPSSQPKTLQISAGELPEYRFHPENAGRFDRYIEIANNIDTDQLVRLFSLYEPLLQQAYAELGLPDTAIRSRLLTGLKTAMATPDVENPILVRKSVMYQYADPSLEALPDLQKLMIRIGKTNRDTITRKLEELIATLEDRTQ